MRIKSGTSFIPSLIALLVFAACGPAETPETSDIEEIVSGSSFFFRTIDGSDNNLVNPSWGSAEVALLRNTTIGYADGASTLAGANRPSAREVSNTVVAQNGLTQNSVGASNYLWAWGQFIDHDIDLTEGATPPESAPIAVPLGDPSFDPGSTGTQVIPFFRSIWTSDEAGVRQQTNQITAFLDGSMVYGSDEDRAAALRANDGTGRLRTSAQNLLPFNDFGACAADADCDAGMTCHASGVCALPNAALGGQQPADTFAAGDIRANEVVTLSALHTLFVREHNRIAEDLRVQFPFATGDDVYLAARILVGAELQAITYREFLPVLLGPDALETYAGYDATVNAGIENAFSTAAYRVGHTMLSPTIDRTSADGTEHPGGHLSLRNAFFAPSEIVTHGIDPVLRGLAVNHAQEIDVLVVGDVRNFLFGPPGAGGLDLPSLNIQRGRDHGLPSYNQARADYGLAPVTSFDEITSNAAVAANLAATYASVDEIDLWVGGLAEDHVDGAAVGPLFRAILVDQFTRIRDGDRFWYEDALTGSMVRLVEGRTLATIVRDNTTVSGDEIPDDVFRARSGNVELASTDTPLPIQDFSTTESAMTAPEMTVGSAEIDLDIQHTYRGDLVVDLIAPDGTVANIWNGTGGSADDLTGTFDVTAEMASVAASGAWTLRVSDEAFGDQGTLLSWTLRIVPAPPAAFDQELTPNLAIPDNSPGGVSSTLDVPVGVDIKTVHLAVDITHTYRGDLVVSLESPDGTIVEVFNSPGDSGDDVHLNQLVGGFSGNASGTWTLHVADDALFDFGTLDRWRLTID